MPDKVTIKINKCRNSYLNGKTGTVTGDVLKVGKTTYKILWGFHQPHKNEGDFSIVPATLEDFQPFMIHREGKGETRVHDYALEPQN